MMQIDIATWTNVISNYALAIFFVLWVVARALEVWLKVYKQIDTLKKERKQNAV